MAGRFVSMFTLTNFAYSFPKCHTGGVLISVDVWTNRLAGNCTATRCLLVASGSVQFIRCDIDHGDGYRPRGRRNKKCLHSIKENSVLIEGWPYIKARQLTENRGYWRHTLYNMGCQLAPGSDLVAKASNQIKIDHKISVQPCCALLF